MAEAILVPGSGEGEGVVGGVGVGLEGRRRGSTHDERLESSWRVQGLHLGPRRLDVFHNVPLDHYLQMALPRTPRKAVKDDLLPLGGCDGTGRAL